MQKRLQYLPLAIMCVSALGIGIIATILTLASHANSVTLKASDLNNSGKVDIVDLSIMLGNFGKAGAPAQGDANNSGKVDITDLSILLGNFGLSVAGTTPVTLSCSGTAAHQLVWQTDYANATSLTEPGKTWKAKQLQNAPGIYGTQQTDRLKIVKGQTVPGNQDDAYRPTAAMRVEVRPYDNPANPTMPNPPAGKTYNTTTHQIYEADGDVNPIRSSDDYDGSSRSEVLAAAEPANVTRWYGFSFFLPADYVSDPDKYLFITQFHDQRNDKASPPEALGIYGKNLRFIMRDANNGELTKFETPLTLGKWMRVEFGIKFDADGKGWVQFWINGKKVAAKNGEADVTNISTLRMYQGSPDAVYLKQGIYRRIGWETTQIIHFGPIKAGTDCMDVLP